MITNFPSTSDSSTQRTMLSPEELSARTGISVHTLARWRTRRNGGEDIGPKFIKIGSVPVGGRTNGRRPVKYLIEHVEEWERSLAAQAESAA
jgi:hypothetical protein